jgi:hypothetical protein
MRTENTMTTTKCDGDDQRAAELRAALELRQSDAITESVYFECVVARWSRSMALLDVLLTAEQREDIAHVLRSAFRYSPGVRASVGLEPIPTD